MKQVFLVIALTCSGFCSMEQVLADDFFSQEKKGWHWYKESKQQKQKVIDSQEKDMPELQNMTPTEQVEFLRENQQQTLHKALMKPTEHNVSEYLKAQKIILEKSGDFTNMYKQVVQIKPEYNGTINYPTSQLGSKIYQANLTKNREQSIRSISRTHGLFYFYRVSCPYCNKFAPIIKQFAQDHKLELIPVSLDGHKSKDFPNSQVNQGIGAKLQVKGVPALYLVEPQENKFIPVSFGFATLDQLEERVHLIVNQKLHLNTNHNQR